MCTAVLVDTVSIQQYIFTSNKLKENIGASYILEHKVFTELLGAALKQHHVSDIDYWKQDNAPVLHPETTAGIGYIGGGNAMLLFQDNEKLPENERESAMFIRSLSKKVMSTYPGINLAFGINREFDVEHSFKESRKQLHDSLVRNKNLAYMPSTPFKHGIADDCPRSNEAQEVPYNVGDGDEWLSIQSISKIKTAAEADKHAKALYNDELREQFTLDSDLEKFGLPDDKGYVAVVHIDGNGMGKRFNACQSLSQMRRLSKEVSDLAQNSMKQLINEVASLFEEDNKLKKREDFTLSTDEEGKMILPIRPIITGGDDITFVCDGRLGVYLAEKMISFIRQNDIYDPESENSSKIEACAGIAIVGTKYPFYRAYTLSEELCQQGKKISRNESWLSYHISTGGFSGSLNDVIKRQLTTPRGRLSNGPYNLNGNGNTLKELLNGIQHFSQDEESWPRSKLMELRDVLPQDTTREKFFIQEMIAKGRSLPDNDEKLWFGEKGNATTPYYDMIELMDFYPLELLNEE